MTLSVITIAIAVASVLVSWRNLLVLQFRGEILNMIHEGASLDISEGAPWHWRYEAYRDGPSYHAMFWQVWRPLRLGAWYPDLAFVARIPLGRVRSVLQ